MIPFIKTSCFDFAYQTMDPNISSDLMLYKCDKAGPSSSSPFPTRWGQRPEFLISRMFCPGHPPG